MSNPSAVLPTPNPKTVTIHGQSYELLAFYYPDYDTPYDVLYQAQFLTNFYPCQITLTINDLHGKTISGSFHNAEAAFQAIKWWSNPADLAKFEAAKTGTEAFQIKSQLHNEDSSYAGLGRDGAMKAVLTQKFSDPVFQQALLSTGQAYLLEHKAKVTANGDHYWSDFGDGSGENKLGKTLMELRHTLGGAPSPCDTCKVVDFTHNV